LAAADLQSVHAAVDATNLANLELGQPTHAFDADRIDGPIVVRTSRPGEKAHPLFTEEPVELPPDTLVIVDDTKVLAIAGVIGCEESKTTEHTTRMLLESATFDPVAVRKASSALGIHTDSSARFERGADPERPCVGAGRVAHLLITEAGWSVVGTTGQFGSWSNPDRMLTLSVAKASSFLALDLDMQEVTSRLERYGFTCASTTDDGVTVTVPTHRLWDVEHTADLYEELAKSLSYSATPSTLPPIDRGSIPSEEEDREWRVGEVLLGMGFYEVITDGFLSRALSQALGLPADHVLNQHVEVTNSIERAPKRWKPCVRTRTGRPQISNCSRSPVCSFPAPFLHQAPTAANSPARKGTCFGRWLRGWRGPPVGVRRLVLRTLIS
jgi:phenylalanyl-tRNA synthetase beta chain